MKEANHADLTISTWGEYYHQEFIIQVSPGLSTSPHGASLSFCASYAMNFMEPNQYLPWLLQ